MKKMRLMVGVALLASLTTSRFLLRAQAPEKENDPVKLTPHMYQVRLENAYIRVLEYHSKPGEKEVMHFHPPGIVYSLSEATIRTTDRQGNAEVRHLNAGDVSWRNKTWHDSENTGKTELHVLAIELKMPLEDLH